MPFILLRLLVLLVVAAAPTARAADNFFEGKTVNLYVGGGAGGGYDQYARLIARHMGKHITGNPTFVVQNMPGAGGLQAANYLYEVARKDGTALAVLTREAGLVPLLQPNASAIKFKAAEFNWIRIPGSSWSTASRLPNHSTTCAVTRSRSVAPGPAAAPRSSRAC